MNGLLSILYLLQRSPVDFFKEIVGLKTFVIILASIVSAFRDCSQAVHRLLIDVNEICCGACLFVLTQQICESFTFTSSAVIMC